MDRNELAEWLERVSVVAEAEGFRSVKFHVDKLREIVAALRESEEWRRDAERFAWLRDRSFGQWDNPIVVSQQRKLDGSGMLYVGPLIGKELDAAIDAARKEGV